jgi:protein TonB
MILHETNDSGNDSRVFAILEYTDQVQALSDRTVQDGEIFLVVEETAYPAEGMEKFFQFVTESMKYPREAEEAGITGRVFIEFVVEKDGTLTNFKSLKGIGHGCDEEAIRVVALSPPWKPALQKGQPVRQRMVLPVAFDL